MTDMENTGTSGSSSVKRSWYIKAFLTLLIATLLSATMLYFTNMVPEIGEWYSFDQSLRLQTQAFMRGELAIQPVPYGHRHDWAWGNGMQQVWGLGVPIIQLPFEMIARVFGFFGFPDRIILLMAYLSVAMIFWKSLDIAVNPGLNRKDALEKRIQNIPMLIFVFLNPAFITMMHAKLGPYEEVIAYGYLWSISLFALLSLFIKNSKPFLFLIICFLSGFAPNLRPTAGAYSMATFLLLFYLAYRRKVSFLWLGIPLFLSGNVFLLITNYLRFGNPLEFGHSLLLTNAPTIDYILKFDNPVHWVPFWSAALELISALFFIDISKGGLLWQSNAPRMREFNFEPFGIFTMLILLAAWVMVFMTFLKGRNSGYPSKSSRKEICYAGGVWSLISFGMLFYFYSRSPAIASRYLVDFGPAIVIGIMTLYFYLTGLLREKIPGSSSLRITAAVSVIVSGIIVINLSQAKIALFYQHLSKVELTNVTNAGVAKDKLLQMRRTKGPHIPGGYICGDKEARYEIPYNNAGWDFYGGCGVSPVTTHFLDNPECIVVQIEPVEGGSAMGYSDKEIDVKIGIDRLPRRSEAAYERGKIVTFCSEKKVDRGEDLEQLLKLISIKWVDARKHSAFIYPPLRLISIRKSS